MSTRLIWRDLAGLDDVAQTLAGATTLAEDCLRLALEALQQEFAQRHGVIADDQGTPQQLVVFGLGKLGGGELNFSSDIDLVYAYPHGGESDGPRALAAEEYFARLGQRLAKLLDEPPSMASATVSTCACVRSAAPAASRCRSRRWTSISSARAATGNATRG